MATSSIPRIGVYGIRNTTTGQIYVGSSTDIQKRWRQHLHELRQERHHSSKLQADWAKFGGLAGFELVFLGHADDPALLKDREQYWIDTLQAAVTGYNLHPNAIGPRGITRSLETRAKIAAARTGMDRGEEFAERCRQRMLGTRASEETKAKMRAIRSGRPQRDKRGLTYEDAVEIRRLRKEEGLTQAQLATRYGVTRNPIREILADRTYTAP